MEKLRDVHNEQALAYLAFADPAQYAGLNLEPADYAVPLFATLIELARDARGDGPNQRLFQAVQAGKDTGLLSEQAADKALEYLLDPPLGVVPDAGKLRRQRVQRDLWRALREGIAAIERGDGDAAFDSIERAAKRLGAPPEGDAPVHSTRRALEAWVRDLAERTKQAPISVGLPKLKELIGGLSPGNVLVVGGATNVGKSSFILEMLLAAVADGTAAGLISMEDTQFLTATRLISTVSGISAKELHRGQRLDEATPHLERLAELGERLLFCEAIGKNEADVCDRMTVMARRGAKLVVIDYLGEVEASQKQPDRRNEIRWITKRLKAHALRLGVGLVLVSQLARPKDGNSNQAPSKHHLKEAGDVENAAEFIVLLWRKDEDDYAPVNCELAKSKMGGVGAKWLMQRELYVDGDRTRRGSARLREVVLDYRHPGDRGKPLVFDHKLARE